MVLGQVQVLGMYTAAGGTQPSQSKNEDFFKLEQKNYVCIPPHAHWDLQITQPVIAPI